jgi:glycosyltransferase involved in cell wall biosynthesis
MNTIQTTIIVPAKDEKEGLPIVLDKIFKVIDNSYEVIVIDDGSTDGTSEADAQFPCRLIRFEDIFGR